MYGSIGMQLGEALAVAELDLDKDAQDTDALKRVALISEAYRNFVEAGKKEFEADFDSGYQLGVEYFGPKYDHTPSREALLGDYIGPSEPNQG